MSSDSRQEPDRALPDTERRLSSICLGIVTVATAAIGVALFTSPGEGRYSRHPESDLDTGRPQGILRSHRGCAVR